VPAKVLFIGLDSAESSLIDRWASSGDLPTIAELSRRGAVYELDNCWETLPGGVWPELTSGRSVGKTAVYFPPRQLHTGEVEPRPVEPNRVDPRGFWTIASDAGKQVAAIDLPWTVAPDDLNGIFVSESGTHDRWFGTGSVPADLVVEIRDRYGEYPAGDCDDDYGGSIEERQRLAADLLRGIDYETRLFVELLGRRDWDLFACAFGQFQCAGHNLWQFMDAGEDVPASLRSAMFDVFSKVDESIAALREASGPEAVTVVVTSHGMGPLVGGPQLLDEVLVRIGAGSGKGSTAQIRSRLPPSVRKAIRRMTPSPARRRLQRAAGSLDAPLEAASTRAIALPGDVNGYIRLNLRGREPNGTVRPGPEAEAELAQIRTALLELTDPESGERLVAEALTAEEAFGPDYHPDVPDMIVRFRNDLGTIESCISERIGRVNAPYRVANRNGDHTSESRLWIAGNRIPSTGHTEQAHALDVAPTILSLLDVPIPGDLEGRPLGSRRSPS
jgi:predicted AlkP superfamily phosphohydrolase/phosphomutase